MDVRALGLALVLVGLVGFLATTTSADHHGKSAGNHTQVPAGCNTTAVRQCLSPYLGSGVLAPETIGVGMSVNADPDYLQRVCSAVETTLECLRVAEGQCLQDDRNMTLTSLLGLKVKIPTVTELVMGYKDMCTGRRMCSSKLLHCSKLYAGPVSNLDPTPNFKDQEMCRAMGRLHECLVRDTPGYCRVLPQIATKQDDTSLGQEYCEQRNCQAMETCRNTFTSSAISGLDDKTCFLYPNFTRCAEDALSSCSNVTLPRGEPSPGAVSSMLHDACTAMAQDGIKAIYTCLTFTNCIIKFASGKDSFILSNFCPIAQNFVRCALEAVGKCSGLNSLQTPGFKAQLTQLAFKAQASGCGLAGVSAESCTNLNTCGQTFSATEPSDFEGMCSRLHTFQSCAGTAVKGCSLTATPPAGANRVPRLDALSTITNKICTAMQNQTLPDCPEFMNCTKLVILPMEPAWKMMNPKAWCHVSVQIAECARSFSRTCMVPSGLKAAINGIYDDLLQEGCYNVFKYVKSPATQAPEKTTDPTSGGSMLMAVSWITMLAMAYLRQL